MRVLDRAGRAVLEVHKPCHFTPPFVRNVLLPVCTEAEVFLVNHQKQGEGMTRPPVVLLGKIKRRWSGGFLPRFTLHGVDGSAFATFKASRSKGLVFFFKFQTFKKKTLLLGVDSVYCKNPTLHHCFPSPHSKK
jgi:hypothetical protein